MKKHRVAAAEVNHAFEKSRSWLYFLFKGKGEADKVSVEYEDHVITRHSAKKEELTPQTQWVYSVTPKGGKESDVNDVLKPKVGAPVKPVASNKSKAPTQWDLLKEQIDEAEQRLERARTQAADADVFCDNELWELINEDRKNALGHLHDLLPEVSEFVVENRKHLHWVSPDDMKLLRQIKTQRSATLDDADTSVDTPQVKRALIYGGDKRASALRAVKDAFEFDVVEWEVSKKRQRLSGVVNRIEHGKYDVVFGLLRFAGHEGISRLKEASDASGTLFVPVQHGYGVSSLKRAYDHAKGDAVQPHGSRSDSTTSA